MDGRSGASMPSAAPTIKASFWNDFGLYWLGFVAVVSYGLLQGRPVGLHYFTFTGAAKAFWAGEPIYGAAFVPSAPQYFYSPSCAAFFYSLFAYLPPFLGRALYMGLSLIALGASILFLRRVFWERFGAKLDAGVSGQLLWVMLSSELNGAVFADKLEILILALFFFSLGLVWQGRVSAAAVLLAVVANWKFQSIPILALLMVALLRERQWWRPVAAVIATLALLAFLPFLFQSASYLEHEHALWKANLSNFMESAWMAPIFHHLYGWLWKVWGIGISFAAAKNCSLAIAASFGAAMVFAGFVHKRPLEELAVLAFGLGAAFSVLCSPLSQGTGYIIYMPLPLALVIYRRWFPYREGILTAILLVGYFFVSLSVSDLTPKLARIYFYDHAYKALGGLILLGWLIVQMSRISFSDRQRVPFQG